jgi:hypothetical protein
MSVPLGRRCFFSNRLRFLVPSLSNQPGFSSRKKKKQNIWAVSKTKWQILNPSNNGLW